MKGNSSELADIKMRLKSENLENVIFISPEYLKPFFEFVRDNKRLFKVILLNPAAFNTDGTFFKLFNEVFSPAMDRFHIAENEKPYIIHFYLGGLIAVVQEWIKRNCADSVDDVVKTCMRYIRG